MNSYLNSDTRLNPEKAIGIPLREVDKTVMEDTFCIISQRWGQTYVYRYSRLPTLYLFHPYSSVRRASIAFTTHVGYDVCLIIIVLANLIELAIPSSLPLVFERVTIIFYIAEAFYETIARGFMFGSYAYLKNRWMLFDFIITLLSLPALELNMNGLSGIQSLRGIRILNLISKLPGIQIMGQGIISSVLRMYGVAMIMFLFLLSVSLAAKQLFMGIFRRKCVKNLPLDFFTKNVSYSNFINNDVNWEVDDHNDFLICGNSTNAQKCGTNYTCLITDTTTVYFDLTSFDTFSLSFVNSFRLLTQDEWEYVYDSVIGATGPLSILFFLPVIFLGSFFLLNLMLVVVTSTFDSVIKDKEEQLLRTYKYYSCFPFDINRLDLYPLPTSPEILKTVFYERDEILAHHHWLNSVWHKMKNIIALKLNVDEANDFENLNSVGYWTKIRMLCKKFSMSKPFHYFILFAIISNTVLLASEHSNMSETVAKALCYSSMIITGMFTLEIIIKLIAFGKNFFFNWWNIWDIVVVTQSLASIIFNLASEYSIFRSLRLLELVKVQQAWPALHRVISIVLSSVGNISKLLIVMIFIMFTFAVIGNILLGRHVKPDVELPRWSFKTFGGSLFSVFQIFTGEWYYPLTDCLGTTRVPFLCTVIVISYFIFGYLVFVSVFTAVLLSAFSASSLQLPKSQKERKLSRFKESTASVGEFDRNLTKLKRCLISVKQFIQSNMFEKIIFVLIVLSCVTMAFEDMNLDSHPARKYVIDCLNLTFTLLFIVEVLLRWFAIGVKEYFSYFWTRFDFILVLFSLLELFIKHSLDISEKSAHALKAFRALRALRLIPRWKSLQLVADSLVISLPAIFNVVLVVLFIWLPFAILGVHFFSGKFFRCVNEYHERVLEGVFNKTDCLDKGYKWEEMFYNFNNIGNSYLSLFQLAMFTGWTELVEMMVDFNEEDIQPVYDNRSEFYVFVIAFVFLGAFFSLNMFVGVAVDTFKNTQKDVKMGRTEILLTDSQRRYYAAMLRLGRRKPVMRTDRPSYRILDICYTVTYSITFRVLILIFISVNCVTIALDSYNDPPHKKTVLHHCDLFFTVSYSLELAIKMLGLRKFFFIDFWNVFDLLLISTHIVGDLTMELYASTDSNPLSFLYAFRLLRILRLLRLTDMLIDLRRLLHAMVASIPSLINISILLFIIVYVYSILGMSFFGHLEFHGVTNQKLNFRTFLQSYLLLFRLTTAQGWEEILEALSLEPPHCSLKAGSCGNFVISVLFVLSFVIISNIILVNIFIAVILENYMDAVMQEYDVINDDNLDNFYSVWKEFDPKATEFILYEQLSDFLHQLNSDLQISKPNDIAIAYMDLPLVEGRKIHCLNVLKGILEIKVGGAEDSATFRMICDEVQKKYVKMFPKLTKFKLIDTTMQLKRRDWAARVIQGNLKKMRKKKLPRV